jgi:hypothetical protein
VSAHRGRPLRVLLVGAIVILGLELAFFALFALGEPLGWLLLALSTGAVVVAALVWRSKRRSLLIAVGLGLGIAAFVLAGSPTTLDLVVVLTGLAVSLLAGAVYVHDARAP